MENEERLEKLSERVSGHVKRLAAELEEKVNPLRDRIRILAAQRRAIETGRISRQEAVARMKSDLAKGKQEHLMKFVAENLNAYQQGGGRFKPLENLQHIWVHQFADSAGLLKFLFAWIDGSMIDEAAAGLPDAPNEEERRKKIENINREIERTEKDLESLLK